MGNIIYRSKIIKLILVIISIIYITFISVVFFIFQSYLSFINLKYISIVLCFLITLISNENVIHKRDINLLRLGMFFTLIADLFLVILDYHIAGVLIFCLVQMTYIIRYTEGRSNHIIRRLVGGFILISISYFWINKYIMKLEYLILIGFFYGICIFISIVKSIEAGKNNVYPKLNKNMIIWGMILFALCDLNVALARIESIDNISSRLIWVFYLPSQVLLSLSGYKY